jgi:hypothetical protein
MRFCTYRFGGVPVRLDNFVLACVLCKTGRLCYCCLFGGGVARMTLLVCGGVACGCLVMMEPCGGCLSCLRDSVDSVVTCDAALAFARVGDILSFKNFVGQWCCLEVNLQFSERAFRRPNPRYLPIPGALHLPSAPKLPIARSAC